MRGINVNRGSFVTPGRYGRLFRDLDPAPDDPELARELGRPFGPMHSSGQGGNPQIPAGFTYLGQFIDHDLTFDPTSSLEQKNDPTAIENFRTAAFELDSLYASGPLGTPYLYDPENKKKLLVVKNGQDLPRLGHVAVTGDPRNDENVIVSRLHTAFLNFHNQIVDRTGAGFDEVQQLVRWHYQWIILHQYLPTIIGRSTDEILRSSRGPYWRADEYPFIPIEFSLAAFRFGHSQIRGRYDINSDVQGKSLLVFPDLIGHRSLGDEHRVEWQFFFDTGNDHLPQPSLPIHPFLAPPLMEMPRELFADPNVTSHLTSRLRPERRVQDFELSLAYRDIRRGQSHELPSGHAVAAKLGLPRNQIVPAELIWSQVTERLRRSGSDYNPSGKPVPLWIYILFEAQELAQGQHIGPVAAQIVTDVFIELLRGDSESFLSREPGWQPIFGRNPGDFDIADLLRLAQDQKNQLSRPRRGRAAQA